MIHNTPANARGNNSISPLNLELCWTRRYLFLGFNHPLPIRPSEPPFKNNHFQLLTSFQAQGNYRLRTNCLRNSEFLGNPYFWTYLANDPCPKWFHELSVWWMVTNSGTTKSLSYNKIRTELQAKLIKVKCSCDSPKDCFIQCGNEELSVTPCLIRKTLYSGPYMFPRKKFPRE